MAKKELIPNFDHPELLDEVIKYYDTKSKINALRAEQSYREEKIESMFKATKEAAIVLDIGEKFVILTPDVKISDKLNKEELASRAHLEKSELSKPYDFSYWTKEGRLKPEVIQDCIETEKRYFVKMRKRKKPESK